MANPEQARLDPNAKAALRAKYLLERDKRLRADGNNQYVEIKQNFEQFLTDPHTPITERAPVTDHVTFTFIGGGFAGLVTGARLKEQGIGDVRIVEKGGDFGGTWYWNRYPGAQCVDSGQGSRGRERIFRLAYDRFLRAMACRRTTPYRIARLDSGSNTRCRRSRPLFQRFEHPLSLVPSDVLP